MLVDKNLEKTAHLIRYHQEFVSTVTSISQAPLEWLMLGYAMVLMVGAKR
jgi:hypothetical protein